MRSAGAERARLSRSAVERTPNMRWTFCAAVLLTAELPLPASAQQTTQRQVDSLAAQVRALRTKLDSVLALLAGQRPIAPASPSPPGDDLAALRAAAAQASGRDTMPPTDTLPTQFVGRERNQAQLNPEIGATGDVRGYASGRGVQRDNFDPREFEIGFQSALDPYSHTKIFVSLEGGHVSVEEGYAYWTCLPGHLRLDFGKYRKQFGGTALDGTSPDSALRTKVGGLEFRLTWRPPLRAMYHEWTLRAELLALQKEVAGMGPTRLAGYMSSTYKLNQRFILGARYDYVESPDFGVITRQIVPSLTLWQSEWVFLRAQYQWRRVAAATADHQIALQAVWAIGPHKHETY